MPIELKIAVTIRTRLKSPHFIHNIVGEISVVKSCDGVWAGSTVVLGVLDFDGDHDDDDNHVNKDDNDGDMDDNDGENDGDKDDNNDENDDDTFITEISLSTL